MLTIKPRSRDHELVIQELEKEILIYDLKNNKIYNLNETASLIWRMCDGATSAEQISEQLADRLKTPIGENVVWLALDNFKQNDLLADDEALSVAFGGLSRREVIRKAGLASMIALPVIMGISAPRAIQAASGCGAVSSGTVVAARQDFGTTCAGVTDAQRSANCNASYGSQCQSCSAEYRSGQCFENAQNPAVPPGASAYNCFCV